MDANPGASPIAGQATVGTTAARLVASPLATGGNGRANGGVIVRANPTNTATVFVGGSTSLTTGNGYPLAAGESIAIAVDDPSRVFAIVAAATQDVRFLYIG